MEQSLHWLELAVTPPGIIVVLLVVSFVAYTRSYWLGTTLLALTTVLLVILSLPLTAHMLMSGLQAFAKPLDLAAIERAARTEAPAARKETKGGKGVREAQPSGKDTIEVRPSRETPQAIVVLGAGRYSEAPEYEGNDTVSARGLVRLRYAAALQRASGLPVLVSGGSPDGEARPEAELMRDVLEKEMHVHVKWVEDRSHNTNDNARLSAELLGADGIGHVYLVTHAWHMRRAARAFERAGIRVTPAPTGYHTLSRQARTLAAYLPSSEGMNQTRIALHERLGFFWYGLDDDAKPAGAIPAPTAPAPSPAR